MIKFFKNLFKRKTVTIHFRDGMGNITKTLELPYSNSKDQTKTIENFLNSQSKVEYTPNPNIVNIKPKELKIKKEYYFIPAEENTPAQNVLYGKFRE